MNTIKQTRTRRGLNKWAWPGETGRWDKGRTWQTQTETEPCAQTQNKQGNIEQGQYRQESKGRILTWTQSNIYGKTWKCLLDPIQSDRAWEVRQRMADNCQMQMCKVCRIIPKKTLGCKGASTTELKVWCFGVWYKGVLFFMNLQSCHKPVFCFVVMVYGV